MADGHGMMSDRAVGTGLPGRLERTLSWNQHHLLRAVGEFEEFYNEHRPHRLDICWKGGNLRVAEEGRGSVVEYTFHHVYTDGRYAYDPRLSQTPIPWGDCMRAMRGLNPGGIRWGPPGFAGPFS